MAKATAKPVLDLDPVVDEATAVNEATPQRAIARQGDDGRPYCDVHNCLMVAQGTEGQITRYKCPVPNCECRVKRVRKFAAVPSKPLQCQAATCQEPPQFLVVNRKLSHGGMLRMDCPNCGRFQIVPVPGFQPDARPRRDEDLGDR